MSTKKQESSSGSENSDYDSVSSLSDDDVNSRLKTAISEAMTYTFPYDNLGQNEVGSSSVLTPVYDYHTSPSSGNHLGFSSSENASERIIQDYDTITRSLLGEASHELPSTVHTPLGTTPIADGVNQLLTAQARLLQLKEGLDLNSRYREDLQNEIEKIEDAQRRLGGIQRQIRTDLIQLQKAPPMSLYPSRKNLTNSNGKISRKLACEFFVNIAQNKLKAAGKNAVVVDQYNTSLLKSAASNSKNTSSDKAKKPKKRKSKKRKNTEDDDYISESEFQESEEDDDEGEEGNIYEEEENAKNQTTSIVPGPPPNEDTLKRQPFIQKVPLVYDTKKWTSNEIRKLRYAVRQQHQELRCKFVLEEYKNDRLLMKQEFEKVKTMSPHELEDIDSEKIDWEKVSRYHVKSRKPTECKKYWDIELARDIKKENWSKDEDIALLCIADEYKGHNWEKIADELFIRTGCRRRPIHCFRRYQRSLNTNMMRSKWTAEEDKKLMDAVKLFGEKSWQQIANQLEERTGQQCLHRWMKTLNPAIKRGRWSTDEDKRLIMAVHAYPLNNWVLVQRHTQGRTDVQCRERWCNILNPELNTGPWSKEEDESLKKAIKEVGAGNWSKIAEIMYPRTDNQCWRRWRLISSEEVSNYRKKINTKKKALVKNFVGREKERPEITADDFEVPEMDNDDNEDILTTLEDLKNKPRTLALRDEQTFLSLSVFQRAIDTLINAQKEGRLKPVVEIECQRLDQIRFLIEKAPYFIGVPPSNLVRRVSTLLHTLRLTQIPRSLTITNASTVQEFQNSIPQSLQSQPLFTTPCIISTDLAPSLPCIPSSEVSLNALSMLQDILYTRPPPKKTPTTIRVVDDATHEEKSVTVPLPIFQQNSKDFVYDAPTVTLNDSSILQTGEFKALSAVFNSLFQKPMQQAMGKVAERLPFLLRRVPNIDRLNEFVNESQNTYLTECQSTKDSLVIEKSKWNTDVTLKDPPTFAPMFSLYQHVPCDEVFEKGPSTEISAPFILVKQKGLRGRPKGSKNKKTLELEKQKSGASQSTQPETQLVDQPVKRGRGRPKGSKNKPKTIEQLTEQKKKQLNKPVVRKVSKNAVSSASKKRKLSKSTEEENDEE